jgi:hypothetical protein
MQKGAGCILPVRPAHLPAPPPPPPPPPPPQPPSCLHQKRHRCPVPGTAARPRSGSKRWHTPELALRQREEEESTHTHTGRQASVCRGWSGGERKGGEQGRGYRQRRQAGSRVGIHALGERRQALLLCLETPHNSSACVEAKCGGSLALVCVGLFAWCWPKSAAGSAACVSLTSIMLGAQFQHLSKQLYCCLDVISLREQSKSERTKVIRTERCAAQPQPHRQSDDD